MASERVTVHKGDDGDHRDVCWLKLDGVHLLGGLRRESHAQKLAERLNTAIAGAEKRIRADEREQCAVLVEGLGGIRNVAWIAEQIRKGPA